MKRLLTLVFCCVAQVQAGSLDAALSGDARTPANLDRDAHRHPRATLAFFQVRDHQTVVEIWPGGGWYTEILAPYLKEHGQLYLAGFSPSVDNPYMQRSREKFIAKLESRPDAYGNARVVVFDPASGRLDVPPGTADRVLTFRNVHNWLRSDSEQPAFELFFEALKPGGLLGVVEHRARPGTDRQAMLESGYMTESYVIELAEKAGFELVARSDINANPADTTLHPKGVWTLPPTLRLGADNREHYRAIGESDRMTLKFRKPGEAGGAADSPQKSGGHSD
jgi:predicted methyltransferase